MLPGGGDLMELHVSQTLSGVSPPVVFYVTSLVLLMVQVRKAYEGLRKARLDEFMAGFNIISLKLKEMYQVGAQAVPLCCGGLTIGPNALQLLSGRGVFSLLIPTRMNKDGQHLLSTSMCR
jgi:hypothetical protein